MWGRRAIGGAIVALVLAACVSNPASTTEPTVEVATSPTIETAGELIAGVPGVGSVHARVSTPERPAPVVEVAEVGDAPDRDGVLAAGPGLAIHTIGELDQLVQVRLAVPKPPTDSAIPVVLHRDDEGRTTVEPALWDPGTGEVVIWTSTFSDRWGAWYDPRNWAEEIVQAGQGAFDFAADFITGRTDPPACGNNPPDWSSHSTAETSSLHVCGQSNPAADGTDRFELLLKSNRNTAQVITIPSTQKDYLWTEDQSDDQRRVLARLALVNPDTNLVLPGGQSMSLGFRQPEVQTEFSMVTYQTPATIVANNALALFGNLPYEGLVGIVAASAKCWSTSAGVDITAADFVETPPSVSEENLDGVVACVIDILSKPDFAISLVAEMASTIGVGADSLQGVNASLRTLAPTAVRLATGVAIAGQAVTAWDVAFDNVSEGRITAVMRPGQNPAAAENDTWIAAVLGGTEQDAIDYLGEPEETVDMGLLYDSLGITIWFGWLDGLGLWVETIYLSSGLTDEYGATPVKYEGDFLGPENFSWTYQEFVHAYGDPVESWPSEGDDTLDEETWDADGYQIRGWFTPGGETLIRMAYIAEAPRSPSAGDSTQDTDPEPEEPAPTTTGAGWTTGDLIEIGDIRFGHGIGECQIGQYVDNCEAVWVDPWYSDYMAIVEDHTVLDYDADGNVTRIETEDTGQFPLRFYDLSEDLFLGIYGNPIWTISDGDDTGAGGEGVWYSITLGYDGGAITWKRGVRDSGFGAAGIKRITIERPGDAGLTTLVDLLHETGPLHIEDDGIIIDVNTIRILKWRPDMVSTRSDGPVYVVADLRVTQEGNPPLDSNTPRYDFRLDCSFPNDDPNDTSGFHETAGGSGGWMQTRLWGAEGLLEGKFCRPEAGVEILYPADNTVKRIPLLDFRQYLPGG